MYEKIFNHVGRTTYSKLKLRVSKMAEWLRELGPRPEKIHMVERTGSCRFSCDLQEHAAHAQCSTWVPCPSPTTIYTQLKIFNLNLKQEFLQRSIWGLQR